MRAEVDGRPTETDPVPSGSIGHFTAMQVRSRAVRGLALHLGRLREGNEAMFGIGLDEDRVRDLVRHALADDQDATVRVYVRCVDASADPETVVTVRPPGGIDPRQRLRSVDYVRPRPHLKHLATEQGAKREIAREAGFDDALLTEGLDLVVEAAIANIGFFDGSSVVWPDAPLLRGITMQLLDAVWEETSTRRVRLLDVSSFDGAFVTNARGIALVTAIDDGQLPDASNRVRELGLAYDEVRWDPI